MAFAIINLNFFSFDAGEFFYIAVPKKNKNEENKDGVELEKGEIVISGRECLFQSFFFAPSHGWG